MSDPIDERLRDFADRSPAVDPVDPVAVRRRGDRIRRRRTALTAAGAALAVALVATPVVVLTSGDDGEVQPAPAPSTTVTDPPSEDPDRPTGSATPLPAYFLPAAGDLPTRDRLTPWEEVATDDEQLVGCQPDVGDGATQVIRRSFVARIAAAEGLRGGDGVAAEVRVSVLQYDSAEDAESAEAAVTSWIRDCADPADPALAEAQRQGGLQDAGQAGVYGTWVYAATEVCTECDIAWFERMGVLADQGRMVVIRFRETGGPLEPEGLDAFMRDLMLRAAGRSMPG